MNYEDDALEQELKAAPWGYGQRRPPTFLEILDRMRRVGLGEEADWLLRWRLPSPTLKAKLTRASNCP